jgi:hypothetical protein
VNTLKIINTMQRYVLSAVAAAMLLGLSGCSGMTSQEPQESQGFYPISTDGLKTAENF